MDFLTFCNAFHWNRATRDFFAPYWEQYQPELREEIPDYMTWAFQQDYAPAEYEPRIRAVEAALRRHPAGAWYAQLLYAILYRHLPTPVWLPGSLQPPTALLGDNGGMFHLMIAFAALPLVQASYGKLGLPPEYTDGVRQWILGTVGIYASAHDGIPGHSPRQSAWLRNYIDNRLFRIGRLEFLLHPYPAWLPVIFRSRATGYPVVLARDDAYRETADAIEGHPIDARGQTGDAITAYPRADLEIMATPWDWVPSMHIPAGGGMTPEAVKDSLLRAVPFFRRYFHREIRLFCCESWIFNPAWETLLPESNMVKFARECHRVPFPAGDGKDGLFFIFGRDDGDWTSYPAKTRMQQAFLRLAAAGEKPRAGGIFIFADDIQRFGSEHYQKKP